MLRTAGGKTEKSLFSVCGCKLIFIYAYLNAYSHSAAAGSRDGVMIEEILYGHSHSKRSSRCFIFLLEDKTAATSSGHLCKLIYLASIWWTICMCTYMLFPRSLILGLCLGYETFIRGVVCPNLYVCIYICVYVCVCVCVCIYVYVCVCM